MAKYKSKADKAFDLRLGTALKKRDWGYVEELFLQYGGYLVLTAEEPESSELAAPEGGPDPVAVSAD